MTIGKRIKIKREELGFTQEDVAKRVGCAIQTIYKYENEIVTNIPLDKIGKIAVALGVTPAYLMGWDDDATRASVQGAEMESHGLRAITLKRFPMLGDIACGEPIIANQEYEIFVEANVSINADFCLTAKGDSMINARIFDGDVVFIKEQPTVENGEIAAVLVNNSVTLKRVYLYPNRVELRPENPTYPVLNYEGEQLDTIRIIGKAVAFQSNIR